MWQSKCNIKFAVEHCTPCDQQIQSSRNGQPHAQASHINPKIIDQQLCISSPCTPCKFLACPQQLFGSFSNVTGLCACCLALHICSFFQRSLTLSLTSAHHDTLSELPRVCLSHLKNKTFFPCICFKVSCICNWVFASNP